MRIELTVAADGTERDVAIGGDRPLDAGTVIGSDGLCTGSVLSVGRPSRTTPRPGVLVLRLVGGRDAGRAVPVERGRFVLGRAADCDVTLTDPDASRRHAVVELTPNGITVADCGSTNGTTLDGTPVGTVPCPVTPGQLIRIGDTVLTFVGPGDTPATLTSAPDGALRVLRPPRRLVEVPAVEVERATAPNGGRPRGVQWVTALVPALAGGAIAWFAHAPQFLLFALLSPVMMISSSLGDRLHWRRSRRRDAATYRQRQAVADDAIADALRREATARLAHSPDAAALLGLVELPGHRLWERRRSDPDVLRIRIGTGTAVSRTTVRQGGVSGPAGSIPDAPAHVDLRAGPVGLAGPHDVIGGLGRWVVGQLAALHSPADVQLTMLLSPERASDWHWARWLPHLGARVGVGPEEWPTVIADLAATVEQRRSVARSLTGEHWPGPWMVLVIDRATRLGDAAGLAALLTHGPEVGVTAVCLDEHAPSLPTSCYTVVQVNGVTGSRADVRTATGPVHEQLVIDATSGAWADRLARALAPLVDAGATGSSMLPASCPLLATLGIEDGEDVTGAQGASVAADAEAQAVLSRWRATGTAGTSAATTIGVSADGPLRIDLVRDGPHALIAGTTGAGKSELLQALVAGLASEHPPDDVNFLLVDYKGGAAFAECALLPHTAGLVTDLDQYLTARALRSLHSELRRRERLFAEAGVADLPAYRAADTARLAAGGEPRPVPRLVIVVDEFAALADELPDFVKGLVGIAQRGRSLGVHLVLATQRPGSAVSPEIRANTSLRIALRVTDVAESADVVGAPDAARIERSVPGRAVLRNGADLVPFQTAFAATPERERRAATVEALTRWRRPAAGPAESRPTELSRLVRTMSDVAVRFSYPEPPRPWQPPLPDDLSASDLATDDDDGATRWCVPYALADLPDEQRRETLAVALAAGGSLLAAGTARSGRTTLLRTIALGAARSIPPQRLHLYVIDAGGGVARELAALPHCATVLGPHELSSAPSLLRRLARMGVDQTGGVLDDPTSFGLLIIDGWESLTAALGDVDALDCTDALAVLLRGGPSAGLTTVLTGDRSVLTPRVASGFAARLLLRQADRGDFGLAGIPPRDAPTGMPPGRAVRAGDAAAVQVALPSSSAQEVATAWHGAPPARDAVRIRPLPSRVALHTLHQSDAGPGVVLGVGGDGAETIPFDPFAGAGRFLIAGPPRSGRSTTLCALLSQLLDDEDTDVVVAAPARSPLTALARAHAVRLIDPALDAGCPDPAVGRRTLLLVDDCEAFVESPAGDGLGELARAADAAGTRSLGIVVAGRSDDLATTYRGVGAQVRRSNCGLLLRPGPVDGELLGVRLPRRPSAGPPGRGVLVGDPAWGAMFATGDPVPIQVAVP